ncbi:MAG: lysophospholipid acyltransferase family protein [Candidatus Caccovivens sp.]
MLLWLARILLWIPFSIMHPTIIKGKKNLPKGKAVLSCNHRSNWDIVLYYLNTRQRLKIMAKKELFKNKFFGWILRHLGGIPIDRDANDINAIKTCMKALKDDKKLFVFPEGTRLKNEEEILGETKSGMAMIAIKTKTPIVPIWTSRKPKLFRFSKYTIGQPFELSEFYGQKLDEETLERANKIVREKMLETRELSLKKKKNKQK